MLLSIDDLRKLLEHLDHCTVLEHVRIELTENNTMLLYGKDKQETEFMITLSDKGSPWPTITTKDKLR